MAIVKDFKVGDRVRHVGMNEFGTVATIENGEVMVIYDKKANSGRNWRGIYDDWWFQLYPDGLLKQLEAGNEVWNQH